LFEMGLMGVGGGAVAVASNESGAKAAVIAVIVAAVGAYVLDVDRLGGAAVRAGFAVKS
jgi:hypothetical protein